jgi:hypothetical protein
MAPPGGTDRPSSWPPGVTCRASSRC